jgi:hypothetical protein
LTHVNNGATFLKAAIPANCRSLIVPASAAVLIFPGTHCVDHQGGFGPTVACACPFYNQATETRRPPSAGIAIQWTSFFAGFVGIDKLDYTDTAAIPEPGSLALSAVYLPVAVIWRLHALNAPNRFRTIGTKTGRLGITLVTLSFVKTAISIPDELFQRAERAAHERRVSRSELYARALSAFLDKDNDATRRLNDVYANEPSELDPAWRAIQLASIPEEEW